MFLAHISDLHFGREKPEVVKGLLDSLRAEHPQAVVISGDLTQRAKKSEYHAALDFIHRLPVPWLVIPGNHDISAYNLIQRFIYPWQKWLSLMNQPLEPELQLADALVLGINTIRRISNLLDWSRGRISRDQIEAIGQRFSRLSDQTVKVLAIHHPFWLPQERRRRGLVAHQAEALDQFQTVKIDLILSGHIHLPYNHIEQGIIISHAGSATSDRIGPHESNSYNLIRGDDREMSIATLNWTGEQFSVTKNEQFSKGEAGWQHSKLIWEG